MAITIQSKSLLLVLVDLQIWRILAILQVHQLPLVAAISTGNQLDTADPIAIAGSELSGALGASFRDEML